MFFTLAPFSGAFRSDKHRKVAPYRFKLFNPKRVIPQPVLPVSKTKGVHRRSELRVARSLYMKMRRIDQHDVCYSCLTFAPKPSTLAWQEGREGIAWQYAILPPIVNKQRCSHTQYSR